MEDLEIRELFTVNGRSFPTRTEAVHYAALRRRIRAEAPRLEEVIKDLTPVSRTSSRHLLEVVLTHADYFEGVINRFKGREASFDD